MGFLFKKKKAEDNRAASLPLTKKVQFNPLDIKKVESDLDAEPRNILAYEPVNYYATKDSYLLCIFHYNEDYSEIYLEIQLMVNDLPKSKTKLYPIDRVLMRDILRKFGQNI